MPDLPRLSAAGLSLTGLVGQTALNRLAGAKPADAAEFDQHVAAVRADLAACREPLTASAQQAGLESGRAGAQAAPPASPGSRARASAGASAGAGACCPDVPSTGSALSSEAVPAVRLLLYYACGLVEAAVVRGWWPDEELPGCTPQTGVPPGRHVPAANAGPDGARIDWESMRMAAICHLVSQAEAAAQIHPDLRAFA